MNRKLQRRVLPLITLLVLAGAGTAVAASTDAIARSSGGFASDNNSERFEASQLREFRAQDKPTGSSEKQASAPAENAYCCAYYIYSARTSLFDDFDSDGFFSYLRITMDIDTDYFDAELYLRVFLRGSDGIWNEIFESNVFTIYGNSGLDDYQVESELYAGYPADYYDVLVEVYDAYTGQLVLEHGPREAAAFSLLPMEGLVLDSHDLPPTAFSSGGGGSLSLVVLWLLLAIALCRSVHTHRARAMQLRRQGH